MLNPQEFLGMTMQGANATKLELIPEAEYTAQIGVDGLDLKSFKYKKGDREGQDGYRMTVKWEIDDPDGSLERTLGRKPTQIQSIMLDVTEQGSLDMGKGRNVGLGRLREAVGQNTDGKPWQPAMLIGQRAKIKIKHTINKENGDMQAEVEKVLPA